MATNRALVFANDEIYHIFNRGVDRRTVFTTKREYQRMLDALWFYRYKNLPIRLSSYYALAEKDKGKFHQSLGKHGQCVALIAFCLMPNHFHIVLKQLSHQGISRYVSNFTNSYTKYFNTKPKRKRVGPLFQGVFKAVRIETDEQLLHLTRYVHLNPVSSFLIETKKLETYPWSSLPEYLSSTGVRVCDRELIQNLVSNATRYKEFVFNQVDYAQKLEKVKHLSLDE